MASRKGFLAWFKSSQSRPKQKAPPPYSHSRIIHQEPTGRGVFAEHERDHHITTSGRRALTRSQFALPPGPEEKRRGIKGRLPIDTLARAHNALTRASMMYHEGHISVGQLAEAQHAVNKAWPSIEIHKTVHLSHSRIIHQDPTERPVFAEHERHHHITTSGRRALTRSQFALPPGPEETRRGIKGRLPIDTLKRAHAALTRASMMHHEGHISAGQLEVARNAVHKAWPSISIHHSTRKTTNAYGLTFAKWCAAASCKPTAAKRRAWIDGEDPSDYRAAAQRRRP